MERSDEGDEDPGEGRVNPCREVAQGAGERDGNDAEHREAHARDEEAENRRQPLRARLDTEERRQDEVARRRRTSRRA